MPRAAGAAPGSLVKAGEVGPCLVRRSIPPFKACPSEGGDRLGGAGNGTRNEAAGCRWAEPLPAPRLDRG